ncbi:MAG: DNA photolyase [Thermodesulfobacteriota bacterium]|nr:DNA photolyase [Thermodesulfobacteriota bacterium]
MSLNKLEQIKGYQILPEDHRKWLLFVAEKHRLSFQQLRILVDYSLDMVCWEEGALKKFYHPEDVEKLKGKQAGAKIFQQLNQGYHQLKDRMKTCPEKGHFIPEEKKFPETRMVMTDLKGSIMGKCPVASKKTRCCNLNTLDAVQQCGFDCSYCIIQSFYHGNQVKFVRDPAKHLETLEMDDKKPIHIGTGQSSDSLMWGNRFGLLDDLTAFAEKHPNVILEMKSKSSRIDYFLETPPPFNMVFTWSLNTPEVIAAEEKGTASLYRRIESARRLADMGVPVGFHFHPMVWYRGWKENYLSIVSRLQKEFSPEEVVMVSIGTLTFIKPVIKRIRERMANTSILKMPMEECAGKLSYPFEIKKELFSTFYRGFSKEWHKSVFFYMCMEDIDLWAPVLGRSYHSNEAFEADMLASYTEKIAAIRRNSS